MTWKTKNLVATMDTSTFYFCHIKASRIALTRIIKNGRVFG
nr:MAG TPA: hypothetical protein [Caudoviricetes sp.]